MKANDRVLRFTDPVCERLKVELVRLYGHRLEAVLLYGSRARGDGTGDSDYDVAVVLNDYDGNLHEVVRLAELSADLLLETDAFVSAKPFAAHELSARTLFMHNLRRDAVPL